jgi:hypothetical protein
MVSDVATEFERLLFNYEHRNIKKNLNNRKGCVVAKTFHKAGIVVPYDIKTDVGYRPLAETESMLQEFYTHIFIIYQNKINSIYIKYYFF